MAKLTLTGTSKFKRLCAILRMESRAHVVGHLEELWNSCHPKRSPIVGDFDDVEGAADWPSSRPRHQLARALATVGFLDEIVPGRVYAIHDYFEHAPRYVKDHLTRLAKEDVTVGPLTYWLGIDAFQRLFEEYDAPVPGEVTEALEGDPDLPTVSTEEDGEGASRAFDAETRREPGASLPSEPNFSALSSQVLSGLSTPPPSSPPASTTTTGWPEPDAPPEVRAAIAGVAALVAEFEAAGEEFSAAEFERRAHAARTPAEWQELWAAARRFRDGAQAPPLEVTR